MTQPQLLCQRARDSRALLGEGKFSRSDEMRDTSIRYALHLGCVDVLNIGFENSDQIDDFAARVRNVTRPVIA